MSIEALNWAYRQTVGNPVQKSVLVKLGDYADESWSCFPSTGALAEVVEVTKQAIIKALKSLVDKGFVSVRRRERVNGASSSNRYYLNAPQAPHIANGVDLELDAVEVAAGPPVLRRKPTPTDRLAAQSGVNVVDPMGVNQDYPGGKPGLPGGVNQDYPTGVNVVDPFYPVTSNPSLHPATPDGVDADATPQTTAADEHLAMIVDLRWGTCTRPTAKQAAELAAAAREACAQGWTLGQVRNHLNGALGAVKDPRKAVAYLRGALGEHLPLPPAKPRVPRQQQQEPAGPLATPEHAAAMSMQARAGLPPGKPLRGRRPDSSRTDATGP